MITEDQREKNRIRCRLYYHLNKDAAKKRNAVYRKNNPEIIQRCSRLWSKKTKAQRSEYNKTYHQQNRIKKKIYDQNYQRENREKRYLVQKKKRDTDFIYRLARNLRSRTWAAIKRAGFNKSESTFQIIGIDGSGLKFHLEKQFREGMTWENYGRVWHVDHIFPLSRARNKTEIKALCRYENLQPLFAQENIRKGNRLHS